MSDSKLEIDTVLAARLRLDRNAGPAARISRERAGAMIDRALAEALQPAPAPAVRVGWKSLASAAAVLLGLSGSAFAAHMLWLQGSVDKPAPARMAAAAPARAPAKAQATEQQAAVVTAETQNESESEQAAAQPEPVAKRGKADTGEPDDLLQAANRLRAQGRLAAAGDVYKLVHEKHAGSMSAYVALVARAALALEHFDNPKLARSLFLRALRAQPDGALDIEARQGLTLALRDLGDAAAETAALKALAAAHPQSPAGKRALARLHELTDKARGLTP